MLLVAILLVEVLAAVTVSGSTGSGDCTTGVVREEMISRSTEDPALVALVRLVSVSLVFDESLCAGMPEKKRRR